MGSLMRGTDSGGATPSYPPEYPRSDSDRNAVLNIKNLFYARSQSSIGSFIVNFSARECLNYSHCGLCATMPEFALAVSSRTQSTLAVLTPAARK
jgi:hypothetical protein